MPRFAYTAYKADGNLTSGEVQASSDLTALDLLSARGLIPVDLTVGGRDVAWWQREFSISGTSKPDPQSLAMFFRNLSSLLSVGVPVPRAVTFCAGATKDQVLRRTLEQASRGLADGQTLAAALKDADGHVPGRFITMIEIGEASNRMKDVAARIAEALNKDCARRREVRAALIYPTLLVIMSALVLGILIFHLAPSLMPVFASSPAEPPRILQSMTSLRNVLSSNWPTILAASTATIVLLRLAWVPVVRALAPLLLWLPGVGPYLRQSETLNMCRSLALMMASGATLPKALATARETSVHPAYKSLLTKMEDEVLSGASLSAVLHRTPLVEPMAATMLEAAEEADRISPVLDLIVAELTDRTAHSLDQAVKLITPLLTLIIGLGVGAVILTTISAILSLNDVAF